MATFNIDNHREQLFAGKPDKDLTVTIDGEDHTWTFKNSGAFLLSELRRCGFQIAELARNIQSLEGNVDDEVATKLLGEYNSAIGRFKNAFKAQVTSADSSHERWINEAVNEPDTMINLVQQMINALGKEQDD